MEKFSLVRTKQCGKCPWNKSTDPTTIPNGYCEVKHANLSSTIASPGEINMGAMKAMACHHSNGSDQMYCVGWLNHQLGIGNNIGLRLKMMWCENIADLETVGPQHEKFEDTLPKRKNRRFRLPVIIFLLSFLSAQAENRQHAVDSLTKLYRQPNMTDTARINILNELSRETSEMDSNVVALEFAMQAKELAEKCHYKKGIAISLSNMAYVFCQQGDYPKSLELYFNSLKMCDTVSDEKEIFLIYNSIGTIYYYQRDNNMALNYYNKAELKMKDNGLANTNLGMVYCDRKEYEVALTYYNRALKYFNLHNDQNGAGSTLQNIGNVYENRQEYKSALDYYFKALEIKRKIKDSRGECGSLGSIGDVYFAQKKYVDAIKYEMQSLELAKKIKYLSSAVQTEQVLSDIYQKMNNTAEAFAHYKQYINLRDSIFNEDNTKKTVRAEMNYNFDKKQEAQKAEQDKKDAINRIIMISISGGLFLVLILSIFIFREYRAKKKANVIILHQKKEVEEQKKLIEEKQAEVLASIRYAKRIQQALLPTESYINKSLNRLKINGLP